MMLDSVEEVYRWMLKLLRGDDDVMLQINTPDHTYLVAFDEIWMDRSHEYEKYDLTVEATSVEKVPDDG